MDRDLHSIKGMAATIPGFALYDLVHNPNVSYASLDRQLRSRSDSTATPIGTGAEYTTEPINAAAEWANGILGTGIGVAVIDSGISFVDDLSGANSKGGKNQSSAGNNQSPNDRIVYSQSFLPDPTNASDQFGHGTHVAGLIAGNSLNSTGKQYTHTFLRSRAERQSHQPAGARQNGQGTDSSVIAAIGTTVAFKDTSNIRVIYFSLGRPLWESYTRDPLCQAVEQAGKAGIVVVVAVGNNGRNLALNGEGYGTIEAPGNDPYVITVGAMPTMQTPAYRMTGPPATARRDPRTSITFRSRIWLLRGICSRA